MGIIRIQAWVILLGCLTLACLRHDVNVVREEHQTRTHAASDRHPQDSRWPRCLAQGHTGRDVSSPGICRELPRVSLLRSDLTFLWGGGFSQAGWFPPPQIPVCGGVSLLRWRESAPLLLPKRCPITAQPRGTGAARVSAVMDGPHYGDDG